jgi:hypothetical protein
MMVCIESKNQPEQTAYTEESLAASFAFSSAALTHSAALKSLISKHFKSLDDENNMDRTKKIDQTYTAALPRILWTET